MLRPSLILIILTMLVATSRAEDKETGWAAPLAPALAELTKNGISQSYPAQNNNERLAEDAGPIIESGYTEADSYYSTFSHGMRTREPQELNEALERIGSADCREYVLLLYQGRAVLHWRKGYPFYDSVSGTSPVTDGSIYQYQRHWRVNELFYDGDIAAVQNAVTNSAKGGTIRDLSGKSLPHSVGWGDTVLQDADSTPPNCPTS